MSDIDRLSRRVPVLCKVAPSVPDVHLEDVHRAGGVMAILGELESCRSHSSRSADRTRDHGAGCAGSLGHRPHPERERPHVLLGGARWRADANGLQPEPSVRGGRYRPRYRLHPRLRTCHSRRTAALPVLSGNIAVDGCIVKTAGVDASILKFSGPARVFESQDAAVEEF